MCSASWHGQGYHIAKTGYGIIIDIMQICLKLLTNVRKSDNEI